MTDLPPNPPSWPQSLLPPPPPPPRRDRTGVRHPAMRIVPFALVAVVVAVFGVAASSSGADPELKAGDAVTDLSDLEVGDCIDDSTFDEPDAVMSGLITIALCDGAHDLEVSRVHTLEAGEGAGYPGESSLSSSRALRCASAPSSRMSGPTTTSRAWTSPSTTRLSRPGGSTTIEPSSAPWATRRSSPLMPPWRGQSGRTSSGAPLVPPGPHRGRGDVVEGRVDDEDDEAVTCRRSRHALAWRDRRSSEAGPTRRRARSRSCRRR